MRTVWRHVKVEKGHVSNPNQYADLGKQLYPKINIEYVSNENIVKHISFLNKKWENTKEIPGLTKSIVFKLMRVILSDTTNSTEYRRCQVRISDPLVPREAESTEDDKLTPTKMVKTQT